MSGSTTTYPYDTIVEVTDTIGGVDYQASGVLISPDEVLTASHVVYSTGIGTATDIEVSPGYEAGAANPTPFGTVAGVSFHYNQIDDTNDLISSADSQNDYAVIHLATPLTSLGAMGLEDNYGGGAVTVSGYPASAGGNQVDRSETVRVDPDYTLYDGTALGEGSSGGPVWLDGSNGQPYVVGLVSSGSGRQGYFTQITTAAFNQIEAWVAADDGTATTPPTTTPPPSGTLAETVLGAGGATVTLNFPVATAALAQTALAQLTADIMAGQLIGENAASAAVPSGEMGELVIGQSGSVAPSSIFKAFIDDATGATAITLAADANDTVVASGGPLTLLAGATSGTLVGGSGGLLFVAAASTVGGWDIAAAAGANTIVAGGGADTIAGGSGTNLIFLGAGASSVASSGTDTIVGGTGAATVSTAANQALAFGGASALQFIAGSGTSTVIAGTGGATLQGGSGGTLFFGDGASSYVGGGGADTALGGGGPLTANANGSAALIFGGTGGGNHLTSGNGRATLVGGGSGDVLSATGAANAVLVAGSGAETLTGAASTGGNILFGGTGADVLAGGAGNDAIIAGDGNDTLSGGGGVNVFLFIDGFGGGGDVVTDFAAGRDDIELVGFGSGLSATVLKAAIIKSETTGPGGAQIALPDGTHVTFAGVSSVSASSFL